MCTSECPYPGFNFSNVSGRPCFFSGSDVMSRTLLHFAHAKTSFWYTCLYLQMVLSVRSPSSVSKCLVGKAVLCITTYYLMFFARTLSWVCCRVLCPDCCCSSISATHLLASAVAFSSVWVFSTFGSTSVFTKYCGKLTLTLPVACYSSLSHSFICRCKEHMYVSI